MRNVASIDVGSHTARLLVARKGARPGSIEPVCRKRSYIRLAEGFHEPESKTIKEEAISRTLKALEEFAEAASEWGVEETLAVSTGVVREARNRELFLERLHRRTGIRVSVISGEEEAYLTGRGVFHGLGRRDEIPLIFDLGGGTTEFLFSAGGEKKARSLPLGAVVLTQAFLVDDPPGEGQIQRLAEHVDLVLQGAFKSEAGAGRKDVLAGTGGTVTTLAALTRGIGVEEIDPERMNGLILGKEALEEVFARLKPMTLEERLSLRGLDRGRADVILAGTLTVLRIVEYFGARQMVVSMWDLLEGLLIEHLEGGQHETRGG
jgi:exopolyphosphatase/guanosine-5'-triphosphate,3'-diphosphate pyrophosphatase